MHMNKKNYPAKIKSDLKISFYNDFIEWDVFYFDEIFSFIQTNNFTRSSMNNIKGNVKNIHYGDILVKYNTILEELSVLPYINDGIDITKYKKNAYVKNGDIIIADTAEDYTAGKAIELKNVTSKVLSGLHTFLCRPKIKIAPMYLGYYLNSNQYHNQLIKLLTGVKVYSISKTNIVKTLIALPKSYEEQEKIAECLKSIDDLILQEEDKLEKLKSHKKGLLQKLFPKDNKSMPELRFPQYKEQWLLEKLIKKVIYKNGKAHEDSIVINGRYIVVNSKFISTNGLIKKYSNSPNLLAKKGDILVVLSDVPNGKALGKCFMVDKDETYTVNQRVCCLTPVNIDKKYLFFILNRNNYFLSFDDGIGQTNLKKEDVLAFSFYAPQNSKEQQKIANCISSIDDLISAQTRKIELLKQHKKGLLQGLFPSIEEVENE